MTALPIVLGINFLGLIVVILLLWRVSVAIHDVSFIDSFWAFGMILVATATMAQVGIGGTGGRLLLGLVLLWGLRLSWHLFLRWRREGEDPRYARIIGDAVERKGLSWPRAALIMAWLMQAPLLFITCLPVQIGIWASAAEPLQAVGAMGWVGVALALGGWCLRASATRNCVLSGPIPRPRGAYSTLACGAIRGIPIISAMQ